MPVRPDKTDITSPARLWCLDLVRALSAMAVLAGHARSAIWVNWNAVAVKSLGVAAIYAATGWGHQAVMVFFVLSGFLVGGSVAAWAAPGFMDTLIRWKMELEVANGHTQGIYARV